MGQMGNSEEATLPDDMPFSMEDLDIEEQENEEEGEVTDSNFNQGGIVTMAEGGTIPTTENTDLNKDIQNDIKEDDVVNKSLQTTIPQQRTMVQQKPLNVRQQNVPMRGMVTNIPKAEDFLKRKTTEATTPYSFLDVAPTDLGSRYTGKFKSKTEEVQKSIGDVKNELDAVLSDVPDGTDSESPSGGVQSSGLDYSEVDRFSLDDDLRGVFNDFSKAQLSMFGVVTSNPFGLAISGIGTQLGPMTGGKTVQGPVYSAELGKMQAKAFHQVALDVTNKYNVTNLNSLPSVGQKELAEKAKTTMNFAKDIYNASVGKPYSSFSFNEKDKKGFVDKAKDIVNAVMSIGKTQASVPTPEIAAKEKAMANLQAQIASLAKKSLVTKQNQEMLDTINAAIQLDDEAAFGGYDVNTPTSIDLNALGFNNDAQADVAANGGSKGIGYNSNGTSYSINNNGTYTHSNGTTTNVTHRGKPINAPDAKTEAEVAAGLDAISQDPSVEAQAQAEKGFDVEETFGSGESPSTSTETFGGDTGDPGDGQGPTGDPDDDDSAATDVTSSSVAGPGNVSMSNDPNDNNDSSDGGGGGGGGGGSHICTATYNTGYIEKDHFRTLKKYGMMLRKTDPYMMKAYDVFGPKVASLVHTNKYVTSIAKFLTEYYKNVMLKKPLSVKQKMFKVLSVGLLRPLWRLIGRFM